LRGFAFLVQATADPSLAALARDDNRGSGDYGCIEAEQQSTDCGDDRAPQQRGREFVMDPGIGRRSLHRASEGKLYDCVRDYSLTCVNPQGRRTFTPCCAQFIFKV
jgi:hypothetical protein